MNIDRRARAVAFIDGYWVKYWTSPSYREIGDAVGFSSKSSVHRLLKQLVQDGVLEARSQERYQRSVLYRVRHQD